MIAADEQVALELLTKGWDGLLAGHGRGVLEAALPAWLLRQRWFGAKTRTVASLQIARWIVLPANSATPAILPHAGNPLGEVLLLIDLTYSDGSADRYQLPLAYSSGAELASVKATSPSAIFLEVTSPTGPAAFHDAVVLEDFRQKLLALIEHGQSVTVEDAATASEHIAATLIAAHESRPLHEIPTQETLGIAAEIESLHSIKPAEVVPEFVGHMPGATGVSEPAEVTLPATSTTLRGLPSAAFMAHRGEGLLTGRIGSVEQSNTNVLFGQRMILKVFRRLQSGLNPDVEIGRFLTDTADFARIPAFLGEIILEDAGGATTTLGMLQGLVANEGDGWAWSLAQLASFYDAAIEIGQPTAEQVTRLSGPYLQAAELLGQRTAEMHLALATPTSDPSFASEAFVAADASRDAQRVERQLQTSLDALQSGLGALTGEGAALAQAVLQQRTDLLNRAQTLTTAAPSGQRIRIHGDYHLGQILRTKDDFVLLDFEGEPAKTLDERRRKESPLRDVAGMLRSFSYVAYAGLNACAPERRGLLEPWAQAWEKAVCAKFLEGYKAAAAASMTLLPEPAQTQLLLEAYLLEKALYELLYELNNRPTWIGIPLAGILALSTSNDRLR